MPGVGVGCAMICDLLVFKTSQTQKDWTVVGVPLELSWTSAPLAVTTELGRSGKVSTAWSIRNGEPWVPVGS